MGQEFFINSQELENKVRTLLPSQGGAGAGFDLSASTQIIPIIDLTESAEGSNVREDIQRSYSLTNTSTFSITNATTAIINTTGYFNVQCHLTVRDASGSTCEVRLTDGVTTKVLFSGITIFHTTAKSEFQPFNFNVFIGAGQSMQGVSSGTNTMIAGISRQIADIDGNLVTPI